MWRAPTFTAFVFLSMFGKVALGADGAHWPQWRGPQSNGTSDGAPLPSTWSLEKDVAWRLELPGPSASTPVIQGGIAFLSATDSKNDDLLAMCVDVATGKERWRHKMGTNRQTGRNDLASPSAVIDGQVVVFTFGDGLVIGFDFAGKELWRRNLAQQFGDLTVQFGLGGSPLLHEGKLYFQVLRRPQPYQGAPAPAPLESFLLAVDPRTGKDLWRQVRPTDAVHESHDSYSTPVVLKRGEAWEIVVLGGDYLTGHALADGKELWRWGFNPRKLRDWRAVSSPVAHGETVLFSLPRGGTFAAYKPDGVGLRQNQPAWTIAQGGPDVCSPLLYRNRLYLLDGDRRVMTCAEPDTGKVVWRTTLPQNTIFRASPTADDGKIYVMNEDGRVFVLAAGDEYRLLGEIAMGGRDVRSSIAIVQGRLYIRTSEALYCVGAKDAADPARSQ